MVDMSLSSLPVKCTVGTVYNSGTKTCDDCPIGSYRGRTDTQCKDCPSGKTTETAGSTSNTDCIGKVATTSVTVVVVYKM